MTPPTLLDCVLALGSVPVMAVLIYGVFLGLFVLVECVEESRERRQIARRAVTEE